MDGENRMRQLTELEILQHENELLHRQLVDVCDQLKEYKDGYERLSAQTRADHRELCELRRAIKEGRRFWGICP